MEAGKEAFVFQYWEWQTHSLLASFMVGEAALKVRFPRLFRISASTSASVFDLRDPALSSWKIITRRQLKPQGHWNGWVHRVIILPCSRFSKGSFSVSSLCKPQFPSSFPKDFYAILCKSRSPKKVNVLSWIFWKS